MYTTVVVLLRILEPTVSEGVLMITHAIVVGDH